ncbi:MAG: hypothetical protein MT490_04820 [Sphingomonas sp.]|uniref:hypothetical protein n=1 Tax=Sphingomonas sp. TaxID=28214 RepID=UPI00227356CA|nr:hypothetical protein [Sphingomonas sp.]MCX8475103.1 hypothetical protein [Sphingomonas sp.]
MIAFAATAWMMTQVGSASAFAVAPVHAVPQDRKAAERGKLSEADGRRKIMRAYALCVADSEPKGAIAKAVRTVMESGTASEKAKDAAYQLSKSWCPVTMVGHNEKFSWLAYPPEALRGQLYRARYLLEVEADRPVRMPVDEAEPAWRLPPDDPYRSAQLLGECIVRAAPGLSKAAVSAKLVRAPEEEEAYAALKPFISACVPAGETLRLTRGLLEAAMAEALYHFATVASPTATSARSVGFAKRSSDKV